MRYVVFADAKGGRRPGVIEGDNVRPFGSDVASLDAFIAMYPGERQAALGGLGAPQPLASLKLLAPLAPKKNVFCVGRNYLAHAEEGARALGTKLEVSEVPTYFTKAPTAVAGPEQVLELSEASQKYDWEAELGVVIGQRCRDLTEAQALSVVFGYTCVNDVSARDLQRAHGGQWFKGKSLDNTCPLGPWIVEAEDIGNPQTLDIKLRVNGVEKQSSNTSLMIFKVASIIANLSQGLTLEPGDVIATGTPDGVGFARTPPEFLKTGDVMEVEIAKIGILRNGVKIVSLAKV
jgi:2-keto-4-pentenoate hydratase/2-oxohepta-3-ene-1,7-dioic acid hydratase in catechol pathway